MHFYLSPISQVSLTLQSGWMHRDRINLDCTCVHWMNTNLLFTCMQIIIGWNQPARIPLVTPGMPWTWLTLLAVKYLSQVALRKGESQNMRHSWVVTVPLAVSMVLAHTSKVFHTNVRFPKTHTLWRRKAQNVCQSIDVVAGVCVSFGSKQFLLTSLVKI